MFPNHVEFEMPPLRRYLLKEDDHPVVCLVPFLSVLLVFLSSSEDPRGGLLL